MPERLQVQGPESRSWHVIVDGNGEYLPPVTNVYANNTVEVVPRSEAEALAEALERIARRSDGDVAHHDHAQRLARKRVDAYRSRHPKGTR